MLVLLDRPALLGAERELVEPGDLALALAPGRVVLGETRYQGSDPIADLECEVRRYRSGRSYSLKGSGRLPAP